MTAPLSCPNAFDRKMSALNRANDDVAKVENIIAAMRKWQAWRIEGVSARSARFWQLATEYQLARDLSDLFGVDTFGEMSDNAAQELRRDHNYDIDEEVDLDLNGDPIGRSGSYPLGMVI
jgi:hypothetical protein